MEPSVHVKVAFGSMIVPASWQGLYGIRPTHGLLDQAGVIPHSQLFDTPGYFSRDIDEFKAFGEAWYGDKYATGKPKLANVFYLNDRFEPFPQEKVDLMESFIYDLSWTTQSTQRDTNVAELWREYSPEGNVPIDEYLETTLAHIQLWDCYHNNSIFRKNYGKKHGREPYVDPMIRFKWELGSQLTKANYHKALEERSVFMSFVRKHLVKDDSILVLPMGKPQAQYRDDYNG